MAQDDRCRSCGQSKEWHEQNNPRHQFVPPDDSGPAVQLPDPPTPPPATATPRISGDPILRMALLKKGLLSQADIAEARTWMDEGFQRGLAVVVVPDVEAEGGGFQYRLVELQHLIPGVNGG